MLVLSRRKGEQVVVPQCGLTVTVLEIQASRVRLGISAPPGLTVYRTEVWQRAAASDGCDVGETLMSTRILLADRDEFLLSSCREHMGRSGAAVDTATTGLECLDKLRNSVPDVLVLEPEILWGGGEGVLAVIHEQPELRPSFVILLTRGQNRSLLYRLSPFTVDDYQVKPISAKRLTERICKLLMSRESDGTTRKGGLGGGSGMPCVVVPAR